MQNDISNLISAASACAMATQAANAATLYPLPSKTNIALPRNYSGLLNCTPTSAILTSNPYSVSAIGSAKRYQIDLHPWRQNFTDKRQPALTSPQTTKNYRLRQHSTVHKDLLYPMTCSTWLRACRRIAHPTPHLVPRHRHCLFCMRVTLDSDI